MDTDVCLFSIFTRSVYKCVFSRLKTEDDLQIGKNIKRQSLSWGQIVVISFSRPLAANLAPFITIFLLPTRLLKLQHVLGLFHFMSNGLVFSVTEEKRISGKNQSFENGFSSGLQCLML